MNFVISLMAASVVNTLLRFRCFFCDFCSENLCDRFASYQCFRSNFFLFLTQLRCCYIIISIPILFSLDFCGIFLLNLSHIPSKFLLNCLMIFQTFIQLCFRSSISLYIYICNGINYYHFPVEYFIEYELPLLFYSGVNYICKN